MGISDYARGCIFRLFLSLCEEIEDDSFIDNENVIYGSQNDVKYVIYMPWG